MVDRLITAEELSTICSIHIKTAYSLKKEIPHIKTKDLGLRFREKDIKTWLEQGYYLPSIMAASTPITKSLDISVEEYDRLYLKGVSAGTMAAKAFSKESLNQAIPGASGTMRRKGRSRK